MLGGLTDQLARSFDELMLELRGIREELALLRSTIEEHDQPTLHPVKRAASGGRDK